MRKKILIIDDDHSFCEVMQLYLEKMGYEVIVREEPMTGLTALRGKKPGLVILDVHMPRGGGKLVFQALLNDPTLKDVAVLVATVTKRPEDIFENLGSKPDSRVRILTKPLDMIEVSNLIKELYPVK